MKEKESYTLRFCKKHQPTELLFTDAELDAHNEEVRKKYPPLTDDEYRMIFGNVGHVVKEIEIDGKESDEELDMKFKSMQI